MLRETRGSSDSVSLTVLEELIIQIVGSLGDGSGSVIGRLIALAGEVGERGTAGTVHDRLGALEDEGTGVARADDLAALAGEVGEGGDAGSIHDRLGALEDEGTGVARADDLAALATQVGSGSDTAEDESLFGKLQAIADEVGTKGTSESVHGKLSAIQLKLNSLGIGDGEDGDSSWIAQQSTLQSLVTTVGAAEPSETGVHLWIRTTLNNMFGLMVAQAKAEQMLDTNGLKGPWRALMKTMMTRVWSELRLDYILYEGKTRRWSQTGYGTYTIPGTHILTAQDSTGAELIALIDQDGAYESWRRVGTSYQKCAEATVDDHAMDILQSKYHDTWHTYMISVLRVPGVWTLRSTTPANPMVFQLTTDTNITATIPYGDAGSPSWITWASTMTLQHQEVTHRILGDTRIAP
jgi:hypothetical protein